MSRTSGASPAAPRRLNVLHVCVPTADGVATVTLGYLRDQVARGWNVTLACPSRGTLGYDARASGARVMWWEGGGGPSSSVPAQVRALRRVVESANPDVVHLHGSRAGLVGRLALRDEIPTVFQPHGWSFLASTGLTRRVAWRWERHATRWTTELVCVSEAEHELGDRVGIVAPTVVVPNGVDLSAFTAQGDHDRRAARRRLGMAETPTVVCVGRLSRQKGQSDLLRAWPEVRRRVPGAELVLVGDGPLRETLVAQARKLSGVSLAGRRTDIQPWYAAADVVAVPSRWEGMALVPLEAMASGRSVVATDVAGMAESVPAEAGAVVAAGDGAALADEIVRRLLDPGQTEDEGWNGRSHVELNHDAGRAARDLSRVYLRLVGTRRAP